MPEPIDPTSDSARIQKQEQAAARKISIAQEVSQNSMKEFADDAAFSPTIMMRRFKSLEEKMRKRALEHAEEDRIDQKVADIEKIEELSQKFQKRNPELSSRSLQLLHSQIKGEKSPEELLRKSMQLFPDHALADEALEFLEQSTEGDVRAKVLQAKEQLNEAYGREVRAGRNIGEQAREFSKQGLGSPTGLRDLYRDITGNPRNAPTLFNELNEIFNYEKMQSAIDFLLHSMGADLKSKGPSIAPGQLHNLMSEARNLLAILWIYRFFKGRMDLINSSFKRAGILLPSHITFELLAKVFVQLLLERYPSMDKVLQLALKLGISRDLLAQLILLTQMRDAVRGVAPRFFRTDQHRHDVLMSFIEAIEELDEQLEEEEEEGLNEEEEH